MNKQNPSGKTDGTSGCLAVHQALLRFEKRYARPAIIILLAFSAFFTCVLGWGVINYPPADGERIKGLLGSLVAVIVTLDVIVAYAILKKQEGGVHEDKE